MRKLIYLQFLISVCVCFAQKGLFVSKDYVAEGTFTAGIEGPAIDSAGNLFVVNFEQEGTIGIVKPNSSAELFIELPTGSVGNSIQFHSDGSLLVADYVKHQVLKINKASKLVTVFASDSTMNQPNDLAVFKNDILFASDPSWKMGTGNLWRIEEGKTTLLEDSMGTTNGLVVSPDKKYLYVNESIQRNVWKYTLDANANISNKKLLIQFPDFGMDGMKCDASGNLYITRYGKGVVAVVSPTGKLIREIPLIGKNPTNIVFSKDGKTAYITVQERGAVEFFNVK